MFRHSLVARFVVLVLAIVALGQLALGASFVDEIRRVNEDSARSELDLAERAVMSRVDQIRAEASRIAAQAGRDPILARAISLRLNDAIGSSLESYARRAGAQRALLVRANGTVVADVGVGEGLTAAPRDYWADPLSVAFSGVGRASGFVASGGTIAMWTAVPSGFDAGLAVVLMQPIVPLVVADFERAPVKVSVDWQSALNRLAASGAGPAAPSPDVRRLYLSDASVDPVTVELRVPLEPMASMLRKLAAGRMPMVLLTLIIAALATVVLAQVALKPLRRLRLALQAQKPGQLKALPAALIKGEFAALGKAFNELIEAVQERESRVMRTAYRDPLTSLPNRALYQERLTDALQEARRTHRGLAVMLIDAQQVNGIREAMGQAVGDWLLLAMASRLRNVLRGADSLVQVGGGAAPSGRTVSPLSPTLARFGGDHFSILLPGCQMAQAERVAQRLDEVLVDPFEYEGQKIRCAVRIGVASFPEHGNDAIGMIHAAETALLEARRRQANVVPFEIDHQLERDFQTSMVADLKRALEAGELQLRYQPKVSLTGDATIMVETLVRWQHPERGLLAPIDFIPNAERTGAIGQLSRWVADQALQQVARWRQEGIDVQIGVNVSAFDLMSTDFSGYVIDRLGHYRLPPRMLTLEIRESALISEPARALPCLRTLDEAGVSLAIDDFGTGFSTMQYLRELPVRLVKIDRRFVAAMESDPSARVIVRSAIELAHSLQLLVVAEGVENAETLQSLRALGCDIAQGFYFGKPLSADDFAAWLTHQSRRFSGAVLEPAHGQQVSVGV